MVSPTSPSIRAFNSVKVTVLLAVPALRFPRCGRRMTGRGLSLFGGGVMEKSESPLPVGNTFTGVVAGSCGRSGECPDETVTTVADFDGLQMRLVGLVGSEVGFETFSSAVRFVDTPDGPAADFEIFGRPDHVS